MTVNPRKYYCSHLEAHHGRGGGGGSTAQKRVGYAEQAQLVTERSNRICRSVVVQYVQECKIVGVEGYYTVVRFEHRSTAQGKVRIPIHGDNDNRLMV